MIDFFIWCSGADKNILEHCPTPEIAKCEGIGGTVFFTGLFAMLSGGYAFYLVFHSLFPAIVLGMIWGLFIFNLDRYIVSSMNKLGDFWSDFKLAIPRLILAILLAIAIAIPFKLKLFETQINNHLHTLERDDLENLEKEINNYLKEYGEQIKNVTEFGNLDPEIKKLNDSIQRIEELKTEEKNYQNMRDNELSDPKCGKIGMGPCFEYYSQELEKVQQKIKAEGNIEKLKESKIKLLKKKYPVIDRLHSQNQEKIKKLESSYEKKEYEGFAARNGALIELIIQDTSILYTYIFITLLFLAIETAPIFVKLISNQGLYDRYLIKILNGEVVIPEPPEPPEPPPPPNPLSSNRDPWDTFDNTLRLNKKVSPN